MADIEVITLSQAVETIKTAILQSQARAARNVSANQLALYFSVGGYISLNTRQQQWGSGAIKSISETLQKELPGLQGFSAESINKMRRFYEEWSAIVFQSPLATKTENSIQQPLAGELKEYDDGRCRHPRGHAPHTPLLRESITLPEAFTPSLLNSLTP